tara:strand:+ start:988 stop:1302 length:315 start_codon:yes stop_codon:yes gene_type:complete
MLTFLTATFSFASFPVSEKLKANVTEVSFPVSETDVKQANSFSESIKSYTSDIEWGAFFGGLLLGLLGVLLVWIFDGDTKSAWKGFGVWLIFLLLVGLGGGAAA